MREGEEDTILAWFLDDGSTTGKLPGMFNFPIFVTHLSFCLSYVE